MARSAHRQPQPSRIARRAPAPRQAQGQGAMPTRKRRGLASLVLGIAVLASGVGFDRAEAGAPDLAALVEASRAQTGLVGVGASLMIDGEVIATATSGEARRGSGLPVSPNSRWHIGSVTKSVTATMIATLHHEGVLTFSTTIGEVFGPDVGEGWADITVAQLLTHRSGAPANFPIKDMFRKDPAPGADTMAQRREVVMAALARPHRGKEGAFEYSNLGFTIAGAMAEARTGRDWETLVAERVGAPLGLDIGFGAPGGPDDVWGHSDGLFGLSPVSPSDKADNPRFMGPAGTINLSIADLLAYGAFHLGDGAPLLPAEVLDQLHIAAERVEDGMGYAFGWVDDADGLGLGAGPAIWHNGSNTMWFTLLILLPERDTVLVLTTNDGRHVKAQKAFVALAKDIVEAYGLTATPVAPPVSATP